MCRKKELGVPECVWRTIYEEPLAEEEANPNLESLGQAVNGTTTTNLYQMPQTSYPEL